ncbi:MAG: V-type ATP synthase subunit E family protein [Oscillospiraceae bacterium]|nr:V-type ATP synthase subunit E family protein [Oscillospiraceae bacterium]
MPLSAEEKLDNFAKEAITDAKHISQEIDRQTKFEFQEKTKDGRKKIFAQTQDYIQKETEKIKKEKSMETSQANIKTRQDYFKYADSISSRVFESVNTKLKNFTESNDYEDYLFQSCKNVIEKNGVTLGIFYMPGDEEIMTVKIKNKLDGLFDISQVEFIKDETIKTGGLRFFDHVKNILINDVFDEKTERAKELLNSIIGPHFTAVR